MNLSRTIRLAGAAGLVAGATLGATATAANAERGDETIVVTENGEGGILLNRDAGNATPIEFSNDASSIGDGSLYVLPISDDPARKFIAEVGGLDFFVDGAPLTEISDFSSFAYDFQIAGEPGPTAYKQFYANVYANGPGSTNGYADCVYNFVPTSGSTEDFTSFSFDADTQPTSEPTNRSGKYDCGDKIGDLAGGQINFVAINLGDTTAQADQGLGGYFDNIQVATLEGVTTYDLEKDQPVTGPQSKDDCKDGGFAAGNFKNQGECVSSFAKESNSGKKD